MFGAEDGGAFVGGAGFPDDVIDGVAVFRQGDGGDLDAEFVTAEERAQVGVFAFGYWDDHAVIGEEGGERHAGRREGLFVGFVAH